MTKRSATRDRKTRDQLVRELATLIGQCYVQTNGRGPAWQAVVRELRRVL